jgi:hypothetical protein
MARPIAVSHAPAAAPVSAVAATLVKITKNINRAVYTLDRMSLCVEYYRLLEKRCRILPAGGLGVSPKVGGYRGLIETILAISLV